MGRFDPGCGPMGRFDPGCGPMGRFDPGCGPMGRFEPGCGPMGRPKQAARDRRRVMMPKGVLIGGKNNNKSRDGERKINRRIPGSDATDHRHGVRGVEVGWW